MPVDPLLARLYYRSALTALRYLDARTGRRRFGADADARWHAFAGDEPSDAHRDSARPRILLDADRIDLLLRDADAQWPGAFGARVVFDLSAVAQDDAFGAHWTPVADGIAVWQQVTRAPLAQSLDELLHQLCDHWELRLAFSPLPTPGPTERWLVHGAEAIASAILAFAASPNAVWHVQVLVVAESPQIADLAPQHQRQRAFERHLAALAAGLLGQSAGTRILRESPPASECAGYRRFSSSSFQGAA